MRRLWQRLCAVLCACCAMIVWVAPSRAAEAPVVKAKASALLEVSSGKVLCAKNAHTRLPMASTTKIMTAVIALENCPLRETVTVTREAYGTEGSSMYLGLGEKVSMEDMLYGLMLASGNDAAVAIALHVGGSVAGFAAMMNAKAADLGLTNTHFVTPNGLHDDAHYTTAYDLAVIAAYAMKNPTFQKIVSTQRYQTKTGDTIRTFSNKNRTLWQYDGGNGVKTGYTSDAGKCLCFGAMREDMQLVGVVLNSGDMFGDAYTLLDYGFGNFHMQPIVKKGDDVTYVRLQGGTKNTLALCAAKDIMIPVATGENVSIKSRVALDALHVPVEAGSECGMLSVLENGRVVGRAPLVASETVERPGVHEYFGRCIRDWSA
ncbi:MAG: D-alanyl-D-alanine carboxypeptidase family protein [Clostridia bacterium]|nr:D-alanyl-D-alanine carboxypeptidase family protein [Clostridia bacterium]